MPTLSPQGWAGPRPCLQEHVVQGEGLARRSCYILVIEACTGASGNTGWGHLIQPCPGRGRLPGEGGGQAESGM